MRCFVLLFLVGSQSVKLNKIRRTKIIVKKPSTKKSLQPRHNENRKGKRKYEVVAEKVIVVKKNKANPGEKEVIIKEVESGGKGTSGNEISILSSCAHWY